MTLLDDAITEKEAGTTVNGSNQFELSGPNLEDDDYIVDDHAQPGVQNIDAVTVLWKSNALAVAHVRIWIIYFVEAMLPGTTATLKPFISSAFARHSLTLTVGILSSVIGGITNLTVAQVLDAFG